MKIISSQKPLKNMSPEARKREKAHYMYFLLVNHEFGMSLCDLMMTSLPLCRVDMESNF